MKGRNKRKERTQELKARRRINEQASNAIEQHNFNKLVNQGVIVEIYTCEAQ